MLLSGLPRAEPSRLAWLKRTPIAVVSGRINQNWRSEASFTIHLRTCAQGGNLSAPMSLQCFSRCARAAIRVCARSNLARISAVRGHVSGAPKRGESGFSQLHMNAIESATRCPTDWIYAVNAALTSRSARQRPWCQSAPHRVRTARARTRFSYLNPR